MKTTWATILGLAAIAAVFAAPTAQATATRADYVAQAEPVCQSHLNKLKPFAKKVAKRINRLFKHAPKRAKPRTKKQTRKDLRRLASFFGLTARIELKTATVIRETNASLATLVPAPGDEAVVASWLDSRRVDATNLATFGKAIKSFARRIKKGKLFFKGGPAAPGDPTNILNHLKATDQIVAGFGFKSCLLAGTQQRFG